MQTIKDFWSKIDTFGKIGVSLLSLFVLALLIGAVFSQILQIALLSLAILGIFMIGVAGTTSAFCDYSRRKNRY